MNISEQMKEKIQCWCYKKSQKALRGVQDIPRIAISITYISIIDLILKISRAENDDFEYFYRKIIPIIFLKCPGVLCYQIEQN